MKAIFSKKNIEIYIFGKLFHRTFEDENANIYVK